MSDQHRNFMEEMFGSDAANNNNSNVIPFSPIERNACKSAKSATLVEAKNRRRGVIMPSGKHGGKAITEIESGYLRWLMSSAAELSAEYPRWCSFLDDHLGHIKAEMRSRLIRNPECESLNFTLSSSQQHAADSIKEQLLGDHAGSVAVMRLSGGAGYGKSYACKQVLLDAIERDYTPVAMATSHTASDVLARGFKAFDLQVSTIAKALNMARIRKGANSEYVLTADSLTSARKLLSEGNLLITDEYSMVRSDVCSLLLSAAREHGGKLLVAGDERQLPSPGEDFPSQFCHVEPCVELIEPMRFSIDSDLYKLEQMVRYSPLNINWAPFQGSEEITLYPRSQGIQAYTAFVDLVRERPDETSVMMFHRRKHVVNANTVIRGMLFGRNPPIVMPDERLRITVTNDYKETFPMEIDGRLEQPIPNMEGLGSQRYYSGEMLDVARVIDSAFIHVAGMKVPVVRVELEPFGDESVGEQVNVLFAESEHKAEENTVAGASFNEALAALAAQAKQTLATGWGVTDKIAWEKFWAFKESFIWVDHSFCLTVHKMQGCSVDNTFLNQYELATAMPRARGALSYVAMTRSSKQLHLIL